MKLFLKFWLVLFLFIGSLKAQNVSLTQSIRGELIFKNEFVEIKPSNYFLKNIIDHFTSGEFTYSLFKPDSLWVIYLGQTSKDSLRANIHQASFQYYGDLNSQGFSLLSVRPNFEEKCIKKKDSIIYVTILNYTTGCGTGGIVFNTDINEYRMYVVKNKIMNIDGYSQSSSSGTNNHSRHKSGTVKLSYNSKGAIDSIKIYSGGSSFFRLLKFTYDNRGRLIEFISTEPHNEFSDNNLKMNYYYEKGLLVWRTIGTVEGKVLSKTQLDSINSFDKKFKKLAIEYAKAEEDENSGEEKQEKIEEEADSLLVLIDDFIERGFLPEESDELIYRYFYKKNKLISIGAITDETDMEDQVFTPMDSIIYDNKGRIIKHIHHKSDNYHEYVTEYGYDNSTGKLNYKKGREVSQYYSSDEIFEELYEYDEKGRMKAILSIDDSGKKRPVVSFKYD